MIFCADDQLMLSSAVIEAKLQQILQPLTVPRPVTQPPVNVKPKLNFSTHPSAGIQRSLEMPSNLASQRNFGSESNLLDSLSSPDASAISGNSGRWSRTGMRSAGSVPDLLSPQNRGDKPPPLPPERSVVLSTRPNDDDTQQGCYDAPGVADAFYNTPPVKHPQQTDTADFYNVPPTSCPAEQDSVGNACYDVPPTDESDKQSTKKTRKKQSKVKASEVTGGDVYNVPPMHNADDSWVSAGSQGEECYDVPSGSGKKSRNGQNAGRIGLQDNQKSFPQVATTCVTDETYDVPSAEQWTGNQHSHDTALSASLADETYDTPSRNEVKESKIQPLKPVGKQSVNFQPLTSIADQTYDTPAMSESLAKTRPMKPHRGKARSSLEPSEAALHSEQLSGQETYDIPATAQSHQVVYTDENYDVPPVKMADEQTYNVPASSVPPIPAKRSQVPPPKPPRPTVRLSHTANIVSSTETSVSSVQVSFKTTTNVTESDLTEKDTVAELPRVKGMLT